MAKKDHFDEIQPDFKTYYPNIVPTKDSSYYKDKSTGKICEKEQSNLYKVFIESFSEHLKNELEANSKFPTKKELFIFIVQYFISPKAYQSYDLDNMAKTILDVLKIRCYEDDGQVKLLLVYKKQCDERVKGDHAYISVRIFNDDRDLKIVKEAGLEKAVTSYQEKISSIQKTFKTL
ncbi:MAG: hypothetical protein ACD_26C00122G0002 [uncultured bacterium]|nr:MAG: hypothetical protein ACD_26C00122G0002 [uncultured bacterium]